MDIQNCINVTSNMPNKPFEKWNDINHLKKKNRLSIPPYFLSTKSFYWKILNQIVLHAKTNIFEFVIWNQIPKILKNISYLFQVCLVTDWHNIKFWKRRKFCYKFKIKSLTNWVASLKRIRKTRLSPVQVSDLHF